MPGSFMSRVFGRKKKQSLSPNKHNQGDTSQDRTIQEENRQGQSNGDNEDSYSQNENNSRLPEETLPIRNDDEVQGTTKIAAQDLWKEAFGNLEQQQNDLMEKFKDLMTLKLNAMGHSKSGELSAQDDWDNMEKFISSQAANVLSPKKEKFYNRVDEAFRILKGIIEMINEPIKLIPQAAAPWAGVNIAVTLFSNPVMERKSNLEGIQTVLEKLRWYQGIAGHLFQRYEEEHLMLQQRTLLREKMIEYFQKLLLYLIRSILLSHTNAMIVALRGTVKHDDWDRYKKEIETAETELDNRIEQFEKQNEREEQEQLQINTIQNACLNALGVEDPNSDRKRIMDDKGGLVPSCCDWIRPQQASEKGIFLEWLDNPEQTIFWITGKAGKGKTMLMCDLIQWLKDSNQNKPLFSFFCEISKSQKTDYNAAATRGLIYAIVSENKQLTRHIQAKWEKNNNLFKDTNVNITSQEILKAILADNLMKSATIFVDALDECGDDLDLLFEIIKSTTNVKWVISSRSNTNVVDEKLFNAPRCRKISLDDLTDVVSAAVTLYIKKQVQDLKDKKGYEDETSDEIESYLTSHSEGTFLWAALACKELRDPDTDENDALEVLKSFPRGLDSMYERMMQKIQTAREERRKLFEVILSINLVVSRAVTLDEFLRLVSSSRKSNLFKGVQHLKQMVEKCGHFFTISHSDDGSSSSESIINFVHKSAKDYLLEKKVENIPLPGIHYNIFEQCVKQMRNYLKRDMLSLKHPGATAPKEHSGFLQLNSIAYACTSWAEHIKCVNHAEDTCIKYETSISEFLGKHFLHWMEALSLLGKLPVGVLALHDIKNFTDNHGMQKLSELVMDAYKFFLTFQSAIEKFPLQVYASALLFSPSGSLIKSLYAEQIPTWATIRYGLNDRWPFHLHAVDNLSRGRKVCFSEDGCKFISASTSDVDIRDTVTFACLRQFHVPLHRDLVEQVELSTNGTKVAWISSTLGLVKILDTAIGTLVDIPNISKSHFSPHKVAFSKMGDRLAVSQSDHIEVWDTINGSLLCRIPTGSGNGFGFCFLGASSNLASFTYEFGEPVHIWCTEPGHLMDQIPQESAIYALEPFLNNSSRLLSLSRHGNVRIWDVVSKQSVFKFEFSNHSARYISQSTTISPDGDFIVDCFDFKDIHVLDLKEQTSFQLEGSHYLGATFSSDSKLLAIQSKYEVWIWDIVSRTVICKLNEWSATKGSVAFSPDGRFLAMNTCFGCTKVWDISAKNLELIKTTEDNIDTIVRFSTVSFSRDGKWLAVVSKNKSKIGLWDNTGAIVCVRANIENVEKIAFSWNGAVLAFGTIDGKFGVINMAREPSKRNSSSRILSSDNGDIVRHLEFSKDDSLLAIIQGRVLWFFDIKTGYHRKAESPTTNHFSNFCDVKFHDNRLAVSIVGGGDIQIWNPTAGVCLKEILVEGPRPQYVKNFAAIDIRLFQGSLQIVSTSDEKGGALNIIDVNTEKRIRSFENQRCDVLKFGPDNNTIIHSDRGNIDLDQFDLSLDQITSEETEIVYQDYGVHDSWVMKDNRPIIWIPPEYQRKRGKLAIGKSQIAIVCQTGHLLFIEFIDESMPF